MNQKLLLFDLDDVLFPLIPYWVEAINKKYKTTVNPEDITAWEIEQFFPSLTAKQVFSPLNNYEFWRKIKPVENGPYYISKLISENYKIKVVTATSYLYLRYQMKNLLYYYPLNWNDVTVTFDKQLIKGDVLVDDGPHNLEGGDYFKILMDVSHNRKYNAEINNMIRAYNMKDVYDIINTYFK